MIEFVKIRIIVSGVAGQPLLIKAEDGFIEKTTDRATIMKTAILALRTPLSISSIY